jgi:hypothetical protein
MVRYAKPEGYRPKQAKARGVGEIPTNRGSQQRGSSSQVNARLRQMGVLKGLEPHAQKELTDLVSDGLEQQRLPPRLRRTVAKRIGTPMRRDDGSGMERR